MRVHGKKKVRGCDGLLGGLGTAPGSLPPRKARAPTHSFSNVGTAFKSPMLIQHPDSTASGHRLKYPR
jgi:hypothetical protein